MTQEEFELNNKKIEYLLLLKQEIDNYRHLSVSEFCGFPLYDVEYTEDKMFTLKEWAELKYDDLYEIQQGYYGRTLKRKEWTGIKRVHHYYYLLSDALGCRDTIKARMKSSIYAKECEGIMEVLEPPYDFTEEKYAVLIRWDDHNQWRHMRYTVSEIKPSYGNGIFPETDEGIAAFLRNGGDM